MLATQEYQSNMLKQVDNSIRGDGQGQRGIMEWLRDQDQRYEQQQAIAAAQAVKLDTLISSNANISNWIELQTRLKDERDKTRAELWANAEKWGIRLLKTGIVVGTLIGGGSLGLPAVETLFKAIGS